MFQIVSAPYEVFAGKTIYELCLNRKNTIAWKWIRKDFSVATVTAAAFGRARINISGDQTAAFTQGNYVWLKSGSYNEKGQIISVAFSSGQTRIVTDITYVQNESGGYVNALERDWQMICTLTTGTQTTEKRVTSLENGDVYTDFTKVLLKTIQPKSEYDFSGEAVKDNDMMGYFDINFKDNFGMNLTAIGSAYVNAGRMKQTMQEYVIFETTDNDEKAKFLTQYKTVPYWAGKQIDLSFILGKNTGRTSDFGGTPYENLSLYRFEQLTFDNGNQTVEITLLPKLGNGVYRTKLDLYHPVNGFAKSAFVWIAIDEEVKIKYVGDQYVEGGYVEAKGQSATAQRVTEIIEVRKQKACDPSIYVEWLNTLGGWSKFLFQFNQSETDQIGTLEYEKSYEYLNEVDSFVEVLGKERTVTVECEAEINDNEIEALRELRSSPQVYLLDGTTRTPIRVSSGKFDGKQTRNNKHLFEIEFIMPEKVIQQL